MGSFPVDIDLRFDSSSALKTYREFATKANAMMKDVEAGVEGAQEKLQQATESFARGLISTSTRAGRAVESSIRALERQADVAGKTRSEQLLMRQEKWVRALGEDQKAIERVTAAFQKLIKVEQQHEQQQGKGGAGTGSLLFRGARDIFEGRTSYGVMDLGRAFGQATGISGMFGGGAEAAGGTAVAGTLGIAAGFTVGLGALMAAGYKAAESMGELGARIRDVQAATGLSAVEVQKFQVVAKMTGQDVSMLDRMMRGLTQTATENSAAAEKGRAALQRMGVDTWGLMTGTVQVTQVLDKMSEAALKQGNILEKDADFMAVLKRAGIQSIATLREWGEARERLKDLGFFDQAQVDQMHEMNVELTVMKTQLGLIVDKMELFAGQKFIDFINAVKAASSLTPAQWARGLGILAAGGVEAGAAALALEAAGGQTTPTTHPTLGPSFSLVSEAAYNARLAREQADNLEAAEAHLSQLRQDYKEAQDDRKQFDKDLREGTRIYDENLKKAGDAVRTEEEHVKRMRGAASARLAIEQQLARLQEQAKERGISPYLLPAEAELGRFQQQRAAELKEQYITPAEAARANAEAKKALQPIIDQERREQSEKFARQMLETRQAVERELDRAGTSGIPPVEIRELGKGGVTRVDVESDINRAYQQRVALAQDHYDKEVQLINARQIGEKDLEAQQQQERDRVSEFGRLQASAEEARYQREANERKLNQEERDEERRHREEMSRIQLADQEEGIKHDADLARKRAELHFKGDNPAAGIAESYRIAVTEAEQLYEWEMRRITANETGNKAEEDRAIALHKLHREDEAAREEAELKIAEMQQKQLETLKGKIEPLYQTLFTNPKQFGQQLRSTIQEAALHPVVSGLSEMTSRALYPFIYGSTGTGGLAGMFGNIFGGGKLNDVKLTPNGSVPVFITGGGGAGTSIFSTGGFGGGGWTGFGGVGPGGTPGFAPGPIGIGGGGTFGAGGGWGALGAALGGFGGGGGFGQMPGGESLGRAQAGPPGILQAASDWIKQNIGGSPYGTGGGSTILSNILGAGSGTLKAFSTGPFANTKAGPGASAVGMMLASAGILGERRGTMAGFAEATAGGFLAAGPLGALIGAGISIGEMMAGVQSQRTEAKQLVMSIYHIGINNTTADQIVSIANQSYGGRVSVAVRSPEVRHMLGLYAAGTGQAGVFRQSVNEPHGASLVESGGTLQQQATYQYGQAYSYASNLPVYGGVPTQTLAAPGGSFNLSLNIAGQDAATFLRGNVVSPDVVQTQYAASMQNSNGRVPQALMMSEPGAIAS